MYIDILGISRFSATRSKVTRDQMRKDSNFQVCNVLPFPSINSAIRKKNYQIKNERILHFNVFF